MISTFWAFSTKRNGSDQASIPHKPRIYSGMLQEVKTLLKAMLFFLLEIRKVGLQLLTYSQKNNGENRKKMLQLGDFSGLARVRKEGGRKEGRTHHALPKSAIGG